MTIIPKFIERTFGIFFFGGALYTLAEGHINGPRREAFCEARINDLKRDLAADFAAAAGRFQGQGGRVEILYDGGEPLPALGAQAAKVGRGSSKPLIVRAIFSRAVGWGEVSKWPMPVTKTCTYATRVGIAPDASAMASAP